MGTRWGPAFSAVAPEVWSAVWGERLAPYPPLPRGQEEAADRPAWSQGRDPYGTSGQERRGPRDHNETLRGRVRKPCAPSGSPDLSELLRL